jgi:hypothetical protein
MSFPALELDRVQNDFHRLLAQASTADLRRPTDGTRWTNEQLLFHMLFGYMLLRVLLPLLGAFAWLPRAAGRTFAGLLDAAARPLHVINYLSSVLGTLHFNHRRMEAKLDRTPSVLCTGAWTARAPAPSGATCASRPAGTPTTTSTGLSSPG